jgi:hypothetical protein
MDFPQASNHYQSSHVELLCSSFLRWTGKPLMKVDANTSDLAKALFEASFVVLSHNTENDPILNYANLKCLELFELSWDQLQQMPSRLTAEPGVRAERADLMKRVSDHGFIDDYSGVRISRTGKRFYIKQAIVWNLIDSRGQYCGQAAMFDKWVRLES